MIAKVHCETAPSKTEFGKALRRAKCILFDMDGVLIDSMPNHAIAWQRSMASFGIRMTALDAYMTEGARGVDTIRKMFLEHQGRVIDEVEAQHMYDEKARLFAKLPIPRIMPYAIELQEMLHSMDKEIGVVTGSGQKPLTDRIVRVFPRVTKENMVTAYDIKKGKPNPDPYIAGMAKFGVTPNETIVVENAPLGVIAGVAAKAYTVAVNTGILDDSTLAKAGADIIFPNIKALYEATKIYL